MFPSMPTDGDRDNWDEDVSREIARSAPRAASGVYGAVPDESTSRAGGYADGEEPDEDHETEIPLVPVRRPLSVAIAGFSGLLGIALILGAQTSGPDSRWPYAIVLFGVQLLFALAWTMAMRPPVPLLVAGVAVLAALVSDFLAASAREAGLLQLLLVAVVGVVVIVGGQFAFRLDRLRVRDALTSTVLITGGVITPAVFLVLSREPVGTQAQMVGLAAAGVGLLVARLVDAVFPKPRIAPQVPRGATGIILGAMLGTLAAAQLGSFLVQPFTPARGAVLGLVAAGAAVLVDLAINFTEAGRDWPDEAPTFWLARHMQGPLGAFAAVAPVAYALNAFFLT
ncbi:hypothetical protein [Actinoplanes sp. NPDC049265]|uniref:hypothetical protein n=1 Tax=Actinoplanes sp. NPDC049265 TaxID=3363902 RepID=UPI00371D7F4C